MAGQHFLENVARPGLFGIESHRRTQLRDCLRQPVLHGQRNAEVAVRPGVVRIGGCGPRRPDDVESPELPLTPGENRTLNHMRQEDPAADRDAPEDIE